MHERSASAQPSGQQSGGVHTVAGAIVWEVRVGAQRSGYPASKGVCVKLFEVRDDG